MDAQTNTDPNQQGAQQQQQQAPSGQQAPDQQQQSTSNASTRTAGSDYATASAAGSPGAPGDGYDKTKAGAQPVSPDEVAPSMSAPARADLEKRFNAAVFDYEVLETDTDDGYEHWTKFEVDGQVHYSEAKKLIEEARAGGASDLATQFEDKVKGLKEPLARTTDFRAEHQKGYQEAQGRHQQEAGQLDQLLQTMASMPPDPADDLTTTIRNTAQAVLDPGVVANLTRGVPVHDNLERGRQLNKKGESLYFGYDKPISSAPADYGWDVVDPDTDARTIWAPANLEGGYLVGDTDIMIFQERWDQGDLARLLIHEVQHAVDLTIEPANGSMDKYKQEFRAYWRDGQFDKHSDAPGTAISGALDGFPFAGFQSERQVYIFAHIYELTITCPTCGGRRTPTSRSCSQS